MADKNRQVKLENKILEFIFEIVQVQFNKRGKYFLKLSVQNGHRMDLLPQVSLDVNDMGRSAFQHAVKTDHIVWDGSKQSVSFERKRFKFQFPRGFCKNDKNYDVHLMIEAFAVRSPNTVEHVGEALFAIYPRTESPKANLLVKKGTDYYRYASVLTLLRPMSKASISMHCGRLSFVVAFREFVKSEKNSDSEGDECESNASAPTGRPLLLPAMTASPSSQPPANDSSPPSALTAVNTPSKPPTIVSPPEPPADVQPPTQPPRYEKDIYLGSMSPSSTQRRNVESINDIVRKREAGNNAWDKGRRNQFPDLSAGLVGSSPPQQAAYSELADLSSEDSFHLSISSTPVPEFPPAYKQKTMDRPLGSADDQRPAPMRKKSPTMSSPRSSSAKLLKNHVGKPGFEEVVVVIHGATSLPSRSDGSDPLPFATLKSSYDDEGGRAAQSTTHASITPTHSPQWEEVLKMEVSEDQVDDEELILTVADSTSKEKLITFRLPLIFLQPFHPYHLELIQPLSSTPSGVRVYVTIQRKQSHLPRLKGFGFCGLEVTLRDFQYELSDPLGPLIAVLRVVPDYTRYKEEMLSRRPWKAGIFPTSITFPSPNPTAFDVERQHDQGRPQVTLPSHNDVRPEWKESMLFCSSDAATMFSRNSALVIELYSASTAMSSVTWTIRNPVGFCTVLLDEELFRGLTSDVGKMGVRVDDLLIQGAAFRSNEGPYPSIRLIMRIINTERPDSLVSSANPDLLPALDTMATRSRGTPPSLLEIDPAPVEREQASVGGPTLLRKKTRVLVKEDEFPPSDALESILPDYVITENDVTINREMPTSRPEQLDEAVSASHKKSLLDHQSQELTKYREAVKRLSGQVVVLRDRLTQLQEENALLRRELLLNKEMGQEVMDGIQKGVVTSGEVADKFVSVKHQLDKKGDELKKYKVKVQHLQNQVIKANDREKGYLSEQADKKEIEENVSQLQQRLRKERKLEETCVQQEKVIRKMEALLNKYMKKQHPLEANTAQDQQNMVTLLTDQNANLQAELERMRSSKDRAEAERAELVGRLERAEHRVVSLESQLDHNARSWAKERHELTVRLQEHRNGIMRASDPLPDPLL